MMTPQSLTGFKSSYRDESTIKEIAKPLKQFDIDYFSASYIYPDGTRQYKGTCVDWMQAILIERLHEGPWAQPVEHADKNAVFFWSQRDPIDSEFVNLREQFGFGLGITISMPQKDSCL
jgi:hypothetical protein